MGAITIRGLDDAVVAAIKRRAGDQGVSMEEEVRRLLQATVFYLPILFLAMMLNSISS